MRGIGLIAVTSGIGVQVVGNLTAGGRVAVGPHLLQCHPVTVGQEFRPGLAVDNGLTLVVVGVGGLLNGLIEPSGLRVINPGLHVRQHVVLIRGAIQHGVDQGHGLGAGNQVVGTELPVAVALNPAGPGRAVDILCRPVSADVREHVLALVLLAEEAGRDGGKLGAG